MKIKTKSLLLLILFFLVPSYVQARTFKVASYNVENLFDLIHSGSEYSEYIPNTPFGWNKRTFNIKLENTAKTIKELNADIIGLQEIESEKALIALQKKLKVLNADYSYRAIADSKQTTVKCALLSKFPITLKKEIALKNKSARNILMVKIEIKNNPLIIFVNHWKSKRGPENMRITYAKALKKEISKMNQKNDFIILGDFNSNYNEYQTFANSKKLNNTSGITGINHILKTIKKTGFIHETDLIEGNHSVYLYNLWLELEPSKRWSYIFFKQKNTPDSIILSPGLYDNNGIAYIDNSFKRFKPDYLFKDIKIYRWQRSQKGKGKHLGRGYSDHLPIFAYFSTDPFEAKSSSVFINNPLHSDTITKKRPISINTATASQLMRIPGIGKALSEKIIAGRPYRHFKDLLKIKGIGKKKLESLSKYIIIK